MNCSYGYCKFGFIGTAAILGQLGQISDCPKIQIYRVYFAGWQKNESDSYIEINLAPRDNLKVTILTGELSWDIYSKSV